MWGYPGAQNKFTAMVSVRGHVDASRICLRPDGDNSECSRGLFGITKVARSARGEDEAKRNCKKIKRLHHVLFLGRTGAATPERRLPVERNRKSRRQNRRCFYANVSLGLFICGNRDFLLNWGAEQVPPAA